MSKARLAKLKLKPSKESLVQAREFLINWKVPYKRSFLHAFAIQLDAARCEGVAQGEINLSRSVTKDLRAINTELLKNDNW